MNRCYNCNQPTVLLFTKIGENQKSYQVYRCTSCGLWQIDPIPSEKELEALYQDQYFKKRTKKGYDNYLSDAVRKSIMNTFEKNLSDLNFYKYEKSLHSKERSMLEVGCAAGYLVEYFQERGWLAQGIDVANEMVEAAKNSGVNAVTGDFLTYEFEHNYDLCTMWATIEHLREPKRFLEKISSLLKPGGRLYLSTCNTGYFARKYKENWRFLNVPEHIWYFNNKNLSSMAKPFGLKPRHCFTYGSGHTTREGASFYFQLKKKLADSLAKYRGMGDMIVSEFEKV